MSYEPIKQLLSASERYDLGGDIVTLDPSTGKVPAALIGGGGGGGTGLVVIEHGANANLIRPVTSSTVLWVGSVTPTYAIDGDLYGNTNGSTPTGPVELPAGYVHRWEASTLALSDGAAITSVTNAVTGAPALLPTGGVTYRKTLDGLTYLEFNGVDGRMEAAIADIPQPYTKVILARYLTAVASRVIVGGTGSVGGNIASTSTSKMSMFNGTTISSTLSADTGWHMFTAISNGASSAIVVDETAVVGDAGANSQNGIRLASNGAMTSFAHLAVCALVIYPTALGSVELTAIRDAWAQAYPGAL